PATYAALMDALMAGRTVRPRFGRHPRLAILGLLEARLQHADLVVLGGLNEGVWPADPAPDPWMSRPMRERFGLPLPERRIGLAAHDFAQLACASEVVLTRAQKSDGTPTVPSRWLLRLETVLQGCGLGEAFAPDTAWLGLQRGLAAVDAHRPMAAPAPTPPVEARPRRLSVTRIETWIRDPYGIYAREVLGLRPLDPLEADPGAADRGTIIHQALDDFQRAHPDSLPDDALARLLALGRAAFGPTLARPAVRAFWWPRFERIAAWFVKQEAGRRAAVTATATEVHGRIEIAGPAGPFTLTATADRIDRFADGGLSIVDYKTGAAPSDKQVWAGYAPQLPLEAVIAGQGGFEGVTPGPVAE
ncbi:MAG: PD-(D/E)XK nuclease family protein, partial [Verrucomicrobiales bacterium]|nr:PD-(D/E)XK nuclease family protein [Verrucomicrobiales bacterium]